MGQQHRLGGARESPADGSPGIDYFIKFGGWSRQWQQQQREKCSDESRIRRVGKDVLDAYGGAEGGVGGETWILTHLRMIELAFFSPSSS